MFTRMVRSLTWTLYKSTGACLHLAWVGDAGEFEGDLSRCFCCDAEWSGPAWINRC